MEISFLNTVFDKLLGSVYSIYEVNEEGEERPIMTFDSITEYGFNGKSTVISHPIEQGYKATEYKYEELSIIEMTGIVAGQSLLGKLGGKLLSLVGVETEDKMEMVKETLEIYKRDLLPVNIKSRTATRENYTLVDYHIKESPENFGVLEVDMTFNQIMLRPNTSTYVKNTTQKPTTPSGVSQVVSKAKNLIKR